MVSRQIYNHFSSLAPQTAGMHSLLLAGEQSGN